MIVCYWKGKLGNSAKTLLDYMKISNTIMDDSDKNESILNDCEKIIVSPWIPQTHFLYEKYWNKIIWDYDYCYEIIKQKWIENIFMNIWITWTDGKSSVTRILYNIFEKIAQIYPEYKTWIWWNYDRPITSILHEILKTNDFNHKHILILELSSFMSYNLKQTKFNYSIWTNFEKDHLNWHPNMQEYFNAKLNLLKQTQNQSFINPKLWDRINLQNITFFDTNYNLQDTNFFGDHNKQNLSACYLLVQRFIQDNKLNITDQQLKHIISQIKPLPHRIELIKEINWIKIYDDWKSTTANSLKAAINSFDQKIILIAWWSDKGDDFSVLKSDFQNKLSWAVLLWQTADTISSILSESNVDNFITNNMEQTVQKAYEMAIAKNSKIILFSPGCASFDLFKNREDRVSQFLTAVSSL